MTSLNVALEWLSGFSPPADVTPSEWAEANMVLPAESNAEPGPLQLTPYQRGLIDAFADPNCHTIVLKLASQTGKSISIDCMIGFTVAVAPAPMLHVSPTESKADDYVRSRLDPLINSTRALRDIVGKGARTGGGNSLCNKAFAGGSLRTASSHKADDLAARAIKVLLLDEVDRFATSAGSEGDPVQLAIKRTRTFRDRKIIIASTPTSKGASRIESWFERGTQERFVCPCPECGAFNAPAFANLKWEKGRPETARLECSDCGHLMTERERLTAIGLGEWVSSGEGEPGIRSFHAEELISKFSSMESVARQSDEAITPQARRVFVNTVMAETFDDDGETRLEADGLQARAEPILAPYPIDIQMIVAGVDVQADRVEVSFVAQGSAGRHWVLDHRKCYGDTAGHVPWQLLDVELGTVFRMQDGRALPIAATAIDANYNTSHVKAFVDSQRAKRRNIIPVRGRAGFDQPTIAKGRRIANALSSYSVGVDPIKASIQKRLQMPEFGPGFIHLPSHLDASYFEGLAAEKLTTKYVRGFAKREFHMTVRSGGGGGNEPLDCLTYALAVASITKPSVLQPSASNSTPSIAERAARLHAINNGAS